MGESYLSFSVDDPKSIAFTASLSKITFGMVIIRGSNVGFRVLHRTFNQYAMTARNA